MNSSESTAVFEQHRERLLGIAYRMLGSVADAQDIVQETFLRWHKADRASIASPAAWLTTVCTRQALNQLNSAQADRLQYFGDWLPEPLPESILRGPTDSLELDESVSCALLVALERLSPHERACYLLHDIFDYRFDEIAGILSLETQNCRQLASRARRHVRESRARFDVQPAELHRLLEGFTRAARDGEVSALLDVLAPDAVLTADGGGKAQTLAHPLNGAEKIARFFIGIWQQRPGQAQLEVRSRLLNGAPGLVVCEADCIIAALSFAAADGRITQIYAVRNPDKLLHLQQGPPAPKKNGNHR